MSARVRSSTRSSSAFCALRSSSSTRLRNCTSRASSSFSRAAAQRLCFSNSSSERFW
ncbi:hypothetical protein ACFS3C_27205 [Azotobacter vinelandii]